MSLATDGGVGGGTNMIASLNVMRWGDPSGAKTVVALHGITANGGAFARPARLLSERGWLVLAPDMRGHGESPREDGDFSTEALLADFAAFVPTAPDVLIGHSFGGYLAQAGVLSGVFRPRALVLEDPVSHFADQATPAAMLAWDEANLPRSIVGLLRAQPEMVSARRRLETLVAGTDQFQGRSGRFRRKRALGLALRRGQGRRLATDCLGDTAGKPLCSPQGSGASPPRRRRRPLGHPRQCWA